MQHDPANMGLDDTPSLVIDSSGQARVAAQAVLDYADINLSEMEAADCPVDGAQKLYNAAKALVAALNP